MIRRLVPVFRVKTFKTTWTDSEGHIVVRLRPKLSAKVMSAADVSMFMRVIR